MSKRSRFIPPFSVYGRLLRRTIRRKYSPVTGASRPKPLNLLTQPSLWLSLGLHALFLLAIGGWVVIQAHPPSALFQTGPPSEHAPMIVEAVDPPTAGETSPLPTTGLGHDDDPGASPDVSDGMKVIQQGMALDIVASPASSAFSLPVRQPSPGTRLSHGGSTGTGGTGNGRGAGRTGSGNILGLSVHANRLGVLLDVSGSMQGILPEVIEQIGRQFQDYVLVLVPGCSVESRPFPATFDRMDFEGGQGLFYFPPALIGILRKLPQSPFLGPDADAGQGLEYIIGRLDVDAIYWFSDFQDPVAAPRMAQLGDLLQERHVRLYLNSVESRPHPAILRSVEQSGGDSQIRKLK
ncbi:MAG: hypothetical protein SFU85_05615 [Candidatus Methylacidiphilales bacterium]|nr:hypothetical protein [Candidatus Methylacidiphilales bacterium]